MACPRCEAGRAEWAEDIARGGSAPKCAFEHGVFIPRNWNCATMNALRTICEMGDGGAAWSWRDDDSSAGMLCAGEGGYIALSWYKNRGCTGRAIFMRDDEEPHPLTLEEAEGGIAYHHEAAKERI